MTMTLGFEQFLFKKAKKKKQLILSIHTESRAGSNTVV